jgi:hypothetical protein
MSSEGRRGREGWRVDGVKVWVERSWEGERRGEVRKGGGREESDKGRVREGRKEGGQREKGRWGGG